MTQSLAQRIAIRARKGRKASPNLYLPGLDSEIIPPGFQSSGVDAIDAALRAGGFPEGRITIIHGPEHAGKTTILLHSVVEVQGAGGIAIYFDWERKLDPTYAKTIGVDYDELLLPRPKSIEEAFEDLCNYLSILRSEEDGIHVPVLIVWDSIQAAPALKDTAGVYVEGGGYSPESSSYSRAIKKFVGELFDTRATFVAVDQVRTGFVKTSGGQVAVKKYGIGNAWRFFASVIIDLKKPKPLGARSGLERHGNIVEGTVVKNCVGRNEIGFKFNTLYAHGVDPISSLLCASELTGTCIDAAKNGHWTLDLGGGVTKRVTRKGVAQWMLEEPEEFESFRLHTRSKMTPALDGADAEE